MKGNLVLIGMPACGKSTVGVVLAKTLGKSFVDTDLFIQQKEGMCLQELINKKGNDYFKQCEAAVLMSMDCDDTIIATGGSAVYDEQAMRHMAQGGVIVYLKLSLETIQGRLKNIKTRGIAMESGETLEELYKRRVPLYEKYADVIIEAENKDLEAVVEQLVAVQIPLCKQG